MADYVIRWKLSELMAKHRIKGKDLAERLGISNNAVSYLKKADLMPEINSERLVRLCTAINDLSQINEKIVPFDLIECVPQEYFSGEEQTPPKSNAATHSSNGAESLATSVRKRRGTVA